MNSTILTNFLIYNILAFSVIFMIDLIIYQFVRNGRWFLLHSIINGIIVFYSIHDAISCFHNPNNSILPIENKYAGGYAVSLHLYHFIFFKMTKIDYIHHFVCVFGVAPIALYYQTKGLSLLYFFGTGLPGGIDYFFLYLMKNKYIDRIKEKKINSLLNNYIRAPGLIVTSYILYKDSFHTYFENDLFYSNKLLALIFYLNGTIFSKMAIENYIETREKERHLLQ